jgi:hypothetical protein
MQRKSTAIEFSIVEEDDEKVLKALYRLIVKISYDAGDPNNIMMDADELFGELLEEVAKGLKAYKNLPHEQKLAVIRRMMDNRVSELRYRYYKTHRKQHNTDLSIEAHQFDGDDNDRYELEGDISVTDVLSHASADNPVDLVASAERVEMTRILLSPKAKKVFDCLISTNNPRLSSLLYLQAMRSTAVGTAKNLAIKPHMIADALMMDVSEVSKCFNEIKTAYRRVCND